MNAKRANPQMRKRLLFLYLKQKSFVKDDLALLREHYDVRVFQFDASAPSAMGRLLKLVAEAARQLAWLMRELPKADLVYGWFADYHMVLPVLLARRFGVPVAVVLGGMDCNHLPELNYGARDSRWRAPLVELIVRRADLLLPVSSALVRSENRYARWPDRHRDGLEAFVPDLQTPHRVVPTGYDPARWPLGPERREAVVATVAYVRSERDAKVKGIDLFVAAASELPDVRFRVVGVAPSFQAELQERYGPPENVDLLPPCSRRELSSVYGRASVYAQLSRTEGMPNVICEAMLCGCIPVGSAVAGIPEAVGEAGFLVDEPDPERIAEVLRKALDTGPQERRHSRAHVERHFAMERREERLVRVLEDVTDAGAGC
jgi:glycosyltransferase involved in cell wall biosynthesis